MSKITTTVRDKHLRLDQEKLGRVKMLLRAKTETEAIEKALDLVIKRELNQEQKEGMMKKIIELRKRIGPVKEDVADWIRKGRKEHEAKWRRLL